MIIKQHRLKQLFDYDHIVGRLRWRIKTGKKVIPGSLAGGENKSWAYVAIDGKRRQAGFVTLEEAIAWRREQAKLLHGEFYRE
jgi:hypothetical protein